MSTRQNSASYRRRSLTRPELLCIARDVLREWWSVLLLSISAALVVFVAVNLLYTPQYTATSVFVVSSKDVNSDISSSLSATYEMADRFSQILNSSILRQKVAEDLELTDYQVQTSASVVPETNLLTLTVTSDSATESYQVARSIMANYNTVTDFILSDVVLDVIQPPQIPTSPSGSSKAVRYAELSFVVTAVVVAGILALLSLSRDTVKSEQDFSEKVDAHLVGIIWHERKRKALRSKGRKNPSMIITNQFLSFRYVEANKLMASHVRNRMDKQNAKVLMVSGVTENEGKSTVAANLALALAQEKKRVLLMDCDFRKPAQYKVFELEPGSFSNFADVLTGAISAEKVLTQVPGTWLYGIFNVTENRNLLNSGRNEILNKILESVREFFDYIIIDTAPVGLVADTEEIASLVDASLLVVRHDYTWARDINDVVDRLRAERCPYTFCIRCQQGRLRLWLRIWRQLWKAIETVMQHPMNRSIFSKSLTTSGWAFGGCSGWPRS